MTKMKRLYILILFFMLSLTTYAQTNLNWKNLIGTWNLQKEVAVSNKDTTVLWAPGFRGLYLVLDTNYNFRQFSYGNIDERGTYAIDKSNNKISFILPADRNAHAPKEPSSGSAFIRWLSIDSFVISRIPYFEKDSISIDTLDIFKREFTKIDN